MLVDLGTAQIPISYEFENYSNLLEALKLGTKDYFLKSGFKKAVLGLSGGIDSALVAYIASQALGPQNVVGISLPSIYTNSQSKKDARELALRLGIKFIEMSIEKPLDTFLNLLEPFFL